jgi:hypothetical protein
MEGWRGSRLRYELQLEESLHVLADVGSSGEECKGVGATDNCLLP